MNHFGDKCMNFQKPIFIIASFKMRLNFNLVFLGLKIFKIYLFSQFSIFTCVDFLAWFGYHWKIVRYTKKKISYLRKKEIRIGVCKIKKKKILFWNMSKFGASTLCTVKQRELYILTTGGVVNIIGIMKLEWSIVGGCRAKFHAKDNARRELYEVPICGVKRG